jgi:flagellar basal body-associated protein FliL
MSAEKEPQAAANEQPAAPPKGGVGRMLVIAFVGIIIVAETAMFFVMVPSAEQVSAMAEEQLIESIEKGEEKAEEIAHEENQVKEFAMGMFGESFSPHDSEITYRVELDLYGLIRSRDEEKMKKEFASRQGRLRNKIRLIIRNSSLEELQENNLGLIERKILTSCNHLLEDDYLIGIGFNNYQFIEQ